jgi:hypothetical protein
MRRTGLLVPLEQGTRRLATKLREPAPHQPRRMRIIRSEHLGRSQLRRHGLRRQRLAEPANHGVDEPCLGGARQPLGALDRVVHNLGHRAFDVLRRVAQRLDQFKTCDAQHTLYDGPGRMRHQRAQRRLQPPVMPDHTVHQMLAARTLHTDERRRKALQQRIAALAIPQPMCHRPRGLRPRCDTLRALETVTHVAPHRHTV